MEKLNLDNRLVGPGEPPYIIAEIGSNHNGDMKLCRKLIDSAKKCGADAVKFQSWQKNSINSKALYESNKNYTDKKRHFGSLEEMDEKYQLTPDQHYEVKKYCDTKKITFLSTGFSNEEIDLLDELDVPAFKIASMDVNHIPLLRYIAGKQRPVILSTGMATLGEIEQAIKTLQDGGAGPVALLHCISIYPPSYNTIHLNNMKMLQKAFDVPVGFSDHSLGTAIPLAAIALGACIIEKHFTLDKTLPGWDHAISANPSELTTIVRDGINIFHALGSTRRVVNCEEIEKRIKFRRCIVMKRAMKKGEKITLEDIDFKRPGTGIHPNETGYVIGRSLLHAIESDKELKWTDLL
jgi:N,N'-diacetyllegionaminate synthase